MENNKKKICLNCRKNWEECHGHKCLCIDGACCDVDLSKEDIKKNTEYFSFGYELSED